MLPGFKWLSSDVSDQCGDVGLLFCNSDALDSMIMSRCVDSAFLEHQRLTDVAFFSY